MKKILVWILAVAAVCQLISCGKAENADNSNAPSALKKIELIGADSTSEGSAGQLFGQYFSERAADITEGRLTVDYHPNGKLGGDLSLIKKMRENEIQIVVCQTAPIVSCVPEMAVFDLPMVFAEYDGDRIDSVLNGDNEFRKRISEAYEKQGLHLLGFLQNATYRLTTADRSLETLDDFRDLRIRTMENDNQMAFWAALGAEPTPLAWPEVYDALKDGSIEAQENAADTCFGASLQDVQKYLAYTDHLLYCNQICLNKETWDSLDPFYQAAIEQAAAEAIEYMRPLMEEVDAYHKEKLEEGGMTLIRYEDAFYDSILALDGVKALYEDIDKNQVDGLGSLLLEELQG